jgi:hypothetical protein
VYSPSLPEKEVIFQSSVGNSPISNIGFLFFTIITTDKTRIKEKNNVIPINWAETMELLERKQRVLELAWAWKLVTWWELVLAEPVGA